MKRMNLLPPELRPRTSARRGSGYVLVAALALGIAAMMGYGVLRSDVHADERELVEVKAEASDAQAQVDALAPYAEFLRMKQTRAASVRAVADSRFDYERLTRELAQVLPAGVWVSQLEVAPAPPSAEDAEMGADAADAPVAVPAMRLAGCASGQETVADAIDRLRALTGATEVTLTSSGRESAATGTSSSSKSHLVSSAAAGDCGSAGAPRVAFDVTVTLSPAAPTPAQGTGS